MMKKIKTLLFLSAAIITGILTLACFAGTISCAIDALNGSLAAVENGCILELAVAIFALLTAVSALKAEKLSAQQMITLKY
jgi:hypothetical protein